MHTRPLSAMMHTRFVFKGSRQQSHIITTCHRNNNKQVEPSRKYRNSEMDLNFSYLAKSPLTIPIRGVFVVENIFASDENIKIIVKETFELGSC